MKSLSNMYNELQTTTTQCVKLMQIAYSSRMKFSKIICGECIVVVVAAEAIFFINSFIDHFHIQIRTHTYDKQ